MELERPGEFCSVSCAPQMFSAVRVRGPKLCGSVAETFG